MAECGAVIDRWQAKCPDRTPGPWVAALAADAELVSPNVRFRAVSSDPDDEVFLECAVAGEAHFLVTDDKRYLQSLMKVRGVRMVSPVVFLEIFRKGG